MGVLKQSIYAEVARELTAEDKVLVASSKVGSVTPRLKKIRAVHHAAARLIATGMKDQEVSLNVGLCPSRLSILKNDPAFRDLVEFYTQSEVDRFSSVQDRMVMLGMVAAEELNDRIEEAAEDVTTKDLTEIMKLALDRGGYAPVTKSESKNLHAHMSLSELEALKQEVKSGQKGQVFKRTSTQTLPQNSGTDADNVDNSGAVSGTKETQGLTLEGLGL
jgi:predicted transcriptional regulator